MKTTAPKTTATHQQQPALPEQGPFFRKEGQGDYVVNGAETDTLEAPSHFVSAKREGSLWGGEPFFQPTLNGNHTAIQPKLTIGPPNDKYEQEADRMAEKVVGRDSRNGIGNGQGTVQAKEESDEGLQPKPIFESEEENTAPEGIQTKCETCEQEEELQKKEEDEVVQEVKEPEESLQPKAEPKPEENQLAPKLQAKTDSPAALADSPAILAPALNNPGRLQRKEEEPEGPEPEEDLRKKPIFESAAEPPDDGIQTKCATCEQEEKAQRKPAAEADEPLMAKSENGQLAATEGLHSRLSAAKGGGQPLPDNTRTEMEGAFGADFSNVRVHTGSQSAEMNKGLHAQAFTHGSDIYFNAGKYNPETTSGKELLAHELTHTVQQGGAGIKKDADIEQVSPKIQRTVDYQATDDGEAPKQRLEDKQRDEVDEDDLAEGRNKSRAEARQAAGEIDSGDRNEQKAETEPLAEPDQDRPSEEGEKAGRSAEETKEQIENPEDLEEEQEAEVEEPNQEQAPPAEAEQAEILAQTAQAQAESVEDPEDIPIVRPLPLVEYKDSSGQLIPPDMEAESRSSSLIIQAQVLRARGMAFREQASMSRREGFQQKAIWEESRRNLAISEHHLSEGEANIEQRRETVELANQAHGQAEERADTVIREAPAKLEEADSGIEATDPVAEDAERVKAENEASEPEDPEARRDTERQGGQMEESNNQIFNVKGGLDGSKAELTQLYEGAQEAKVRNAESKAQITRVQGEIEQMDGKIQEMNQTNIRGREVLAQSESTPDEVLEESEVLDQKGQNLISISLAAETGLHQAARNRQSNASAIRPPEQEEEGAVQTKPEEDGVIQREQGDYERMRGERDVNDIPEEELTPQQREVRERNRVELEAIESMLGDRAMSELSGGEKVWIGIRAKGVRFWQWIKDQFTWAKIGNLFIQALNPITWLRLGFNLVFGGIIGGVGMIAGGVSTLIDNFGFNWETLKGFADIVTGIAMIAGTIAGIAIGISALLAVLVILSWGGYLPIAILQSPILANIISVSGTIALWAGGIGLLLNLIALGKSLSDVGAASSAEELQGEMNDVVEDSGRSLVAALSMVGGRWAGGKFRPGGGLQGVSGSLSRAGGNLPTRAVAQAQGVNAVSQTARIGLMRYMAGLPFGKFALRRLRPGAGLGIGQRLRSVGTGLRNAFGSARAGVQSIWQRVQRWNRRRQLAALRRQVLNQRARSLDNPSGAHSYARHGAHTSWWQHYRRLITGRAPDGHKASSPPSYSGRFASDAKQMQGARAVWDYITNNPFIRHKSGNPNKALKSMIELPPIPLNGAGTSFYLGSFRIGRFGFLRWRRVNQIKVFVKQDPATGQMHIHTMYPVP